ncbi:MAG: 2-oxoacid:ferredoxin oxidoreductase subunit beta [Kofleriaceae bacterium]
MTAPAEKLVKLTKKDFESNQDVRWCPGCGDYAILSTVQRAMAQLGVRRENTVFISGIGCSSRFPYYMNTYGFHTIHGRAPAVATGLKLTRPELDVWVITGDGDGLSIGGNHLVHALRRNMDLKIILFNNQIYGLTKGQYSPTSKVGTKAASTPGGSIDHPINPLVLALGAGASFVARCTDTDAKLMMTILERAYAHQGSVIIEVLQNCPVFNDAVWDGVKDDKDGSQLVLTEGKPLTFARGTKGVMLGQDLLPKVVEVGDGPGQHAEADLMIHHEESSSTYGRLLAGMVYPEFPMPVGVLHRESRPTYERMVNAQVADAIKAQGPGDLQKLLNSGMTWEISDGSERH